MILVDTSIWVDHFRNGDDLLVKRLTAGEVVTHSCVIGELALGGLSKPSQILGFLLELPKLPSLLENEVLHFIARQKLAGTGIGYVDAHLLAAAKLYSAQIWTRDKRFEHVAREHSLAFSPAH